jgi:glutaconate CoA-transferase subunit B
VLTAVHPGVDPATVRERTGWDLRIADDLGLSEPPTDRELSVLRELTR